MISKRYKLNKVDGLKIAKGAVIAVSGAFLTYLMEVVAQTDFGTYTMSIVAVSSILINVAMKLLSGKK